MITEDLFEKVLIDPAKKDGANKLLIISGFASPNMLDKQLRTLNKDGPSINIDLIVGMPKLNGILKAHHLEFQKADQNGLYGNDVTCSYIVDGCQVHAKSYVWLADDQPIKAFSGSANYTNTGFGKGQVEILSEVDVALAKTFFENCANNSLRCNHDDIENSVLIHEKSKSTDGNAKQFAQAESVTLSLLDSRTGETPARSGLNWGQREGRNPDQAYISVPVEVQKAEFFPPREDQFTVWADDSTSFIFVVAQDNGKALHTSEDNSQLGSYLRKRLGVSSGQYVTKDDLLNYGRTDVTFTKLDDDTYYMDFLPPSEFDGEQDES